MSTSQDRDNPFAPPTAAVLEPAALELGQYVPGGRKVPAGRGVAWFGEAWDLFKRSPGKWIVILIVFLLISIVLAVLPLGPVGPNVNTPVFTPGILVGWRTIYEGGSLEA